MAAILVATIKRFLGTAAEMAAMDVTGIPAGSTFFQTDTGLLYNLDSAGNWAVKKIIGDVNIQVGDVDVGAANPVPMQLTGSTVPDTQAVPVRNQYKITVETLTNAESVAAGLYTTPADLNITTESEVWIVVSIDKQPWTLETNYLTYLGGMTEKCCYPKRSGEANTYPDLVPCLSIFMGMPIEADGFATPASLAEAKAFKLYFSGAKARVQNGHATDVATITVKIMRVWRD